MAIINELAERRGAEDMANAALQAQAGTGTIGVRAIWMSMANWIRQIRMELRSRLQQQSWTDFGCRNGPNSLIL